MFSQQDSWYAQLYEKFRNERRHTVDPEVIIHNKRKSCSTPVQHKQQRGAINWNPPFPEGEDEESMAIHVEFLKKEWQKRTVDLEKIDRRMALTFPSRRKMINNGTAIKDIKTEYPVLFSCEQVNI